MNQKMCFIAEEILEPEVLKEKEFTEYEIVTKFLDDHYKFKGKLSAAWQEILECAEYELKETEGTFFIKEFSDNINLAEIDSNYL